MSISHIDNLAMQAVVFFNGLLNRVLYSKRIVRRQASLLLHEIYMVEYLRIADCNGYLLYLNLNSFVFFYSFFKKRVHIRYIIEYVETSAVIFFKLDEYFTKRALYTSILYYKTTLYSIINGPKIQNLGGRAASARSICTHVTTPCIYYIYINMLSICTLNIIYIYIKIKHGDL